MTTIKLFELNGNVAVITGGNGGIGRSIAIALAEAGASVAIFGRNEEKNENTLSELKEIGIPAMAMQVDITNRSALEPAVTKVENELGNISILVNNAAIDLFSGGVLNETEENWDSVIETNLNSIFLLSKLVAKSMVENKRGKIINIGSIYSFFGAGKGPSYSASKGAVIQLTKSMAIELAQHNVQVNAIAPGWFETDMTASNKGQPFYDEVVLRTPAGRWGQTEDVVGTAIFLASKASDFVTGETIRVDGGFSIR
jgi:2-deoxy-D-gluconate 3-dehydrogenase